MAVFGLQVKADLFLIQQVDIGFTLLMDGHGHLIIAGVGRLSIMDVGLMIRFMDGCGFLVMNGVRHGYHGEPAAVIMVGHL